MSKRIRIGLLTGIFAVATAVVGVVSSVSEPAKFQAVEVLATATLPPENDIFLSPTTSYGFYAMNKSGTPDNPVVVWGNGATLQCVHITGNWVIWKDTTVTNCITFGIRVNGSHVEVLNNHIYDTAKGNLLSMGKCDDSSTASWHSGIRVADNTDVRVAYNRVHESCGEGIGFLRTSNGKIEFNEVWDVFSVNIYCDQCIEVNIIGNLSYSTGNTNYYKVGKVARGISLGAELYSGHPFGLRDINIINNELRNVRGINLIQEQAGTPERILVKDNIFVNVVQPYISLGTWATIINNVTATPSGATSVPSTSTVTRTPTQVASPTSTVTRTPTTVPSPTSTLTLVPTVTRTPTSTLTVTPTVTFTSTYTATNTLTPSSSPVPSVVPTICETAVTEHFWFMGCTK